MMYDSPKHIAHSAKYDEIDEIQKSMKNLQRPQGPLDSLAFPVRVDRDENVSLRGGPQIQR